MKSRTSAVIVSLLVMALVVSGCSSAATATQPAATKAVQPTAVSTAKPATHTTFRMVQSEPTSLDPDISNDWSPWLWDNMFEQMWRILNDGTQEYFGGKDAKMSDDGKTWTFTLNPAYKWSDGEPVTAHDYEFSWKRKIDPKTGGQSGYFLAPYVKNGADFESGKITDASQVGIKAIDDYTFQVTFDNPAPFFFHIAGLYALAPTPKHVVEKYGDKWTEAANIVTNGPYMMESHIPDQSMILVRNPYYGGKPAAIGRVEYIMSADTCPASLRAYEADEIDFTNCIPPEEALRVSKDPVLKNELRGEQITATEWVQFDCTKAPWNDIRVRQAFNLATDREVIVQGVGDGLTGVPAYTLVPPGIDGNNPNDRLQGGVPQAKKLLADAGFPDGKGFPEFTITGSSRTHKQLIEVLQQMWADTLGVHGKINMLEETAFRAWLRERKTESYDIAASRFWTDYMDPNNWYQECIISDIRNMKWVNQQFIDLVRQGVSEPDSAKRKDFFLQANKILETESPAIACYYDKDLWLVKPWVKNLQHDRVIGFYRIADVTY